MKKPVRPLTVKQITLAKVADLDAKIAALAARLKALDHERDSLADFTIDAIESGAVIEPGVFQAAIDLDKRRNPSWKGVVVAKLGAEEAERILRETEPTITKRLIVSKA